jgi:hypothetical protein
VLDLYVQILTAFRSEILAAPLVRTHEGPVDFLGCPPLVLLSLLFLGYGFANLFFGGSIGDCILAHLEGLLFLDLFLDLEVFETSLSVLGFLQ